MQDRKESVREAVDFEVTGDALFSTVTVLTVSGVIFCDGSSWWSTWHTWGKGTPTEELQPQDWPVDTSVGHFLACYFMWKSLATVGAAALKQGVLGCIWRIAEQKLEGLWPGNVSQIHSFLPELLLVMHSIYHRDRKHTRTPSKLSVIWHFHGQSWLSTSWDLESPWKQVSGSICEGLSGY